MRQQRGSGLLLQEWFSICSRHRDNVEDCPLCEKGEWKYIATLRLSRMLYVVSPRFWRAWANRPFLNPSRRFFESVFPNLKR